MSCGAQSKIKTNQFYALNGETVFFFLCGTARDKKA